jgi:hypothetical protein
METLNAIKADAEGGLEAGLKAERDGFGRLGKSDVSPALRGLFESRTAPQKEPLWQPCTPCEQGGCERPWPHGRWHCSELSAGQAGQQVLLKDKLAEGLARGEEQMQVNLDALVRSMEVNVFERNSVVRRACTSLRRA